MEFWCNLNAIDLWLIYPQVVGDTARVYNAGLLLLVAEKQ